MNEEKESHVDAKTRACFLAKTRACFLVSHLAIKLWSVSSLSQQDANVQLLSFIQVQCLFHDHFLQPVDPRKEVGFPPKPLPGAQGQGYATASGDPADFAGGTDRVGWKRTSKMPNAVPPRTSLRQ